MWRNYLLVASRNLIRHRIFSFINIFGLALGFAAGTAIMTFVLYETSYDVDLPQVERSFQVQNAFSAEANGGQAVNLQVTSLAALAALRKDFPEIDRAVYVQTNGLRVKQDGRVEQVDGGAHVDGSFFEVIRQPFVRGKAAGSLDDPHALVLSETEARKRFGQQDPVGHTLTLIDNGVPSDYRITGVFRDFPGNSQFRNLAIVARFDPAAAMADCSNCLTSWTTQLGTVYLSLHRADASGRINARLAAWEKRNIPDQIIDGKKKNAGDDQDWKLVNLRDIHLGTGVGGPVPIGDRKALAAMAIVGLLIVAMAAMNFTNLSTARAGERAREVALRKVLGARRGQLIVQFLTESVVIASLSAMLGLMIFELSLPALNAFLGTDMHVLYFGTRGIVLPLAVATLVVGIAGGVYPAILLSSFRPAKTLKANRSGADAGGSGRLRSVLVVVQFAASISLIICTAIIFEQTRFSRNVDAGYKREGLLQVFGLYDRRAQASAGALASELRRQRGILRVARSDLGIASTYNSTTEVRRLGQISGVVLGDYGIDEQTLPALGVPLVAGRNFSLAAALDRVRRPLESDDLDVLARGSNVLLSRGAAAKLGFASPAQAVGQQIQANIVNRSLGRAAVVTVVGVVDDVRYRSTREPIQPILYSGFDNGQFMFVRFTGMAPSQARQLVEAAWKRHMPDVPFSARLVSDIVQESYDADETRAELFGAFSILAVLIGCLGLFGLAAFSAQRRTKEIGIRKILGARTRDIMQLLLWQFSKPILVANLIAWPISWYVMRRWLEQFDERIDLGIAPFIIAGSMALLVALATVTAHTYRVARVRPAFALRYE